MPIRIDSPAQIPQPTVSKNESVSAEVHEAGEAVATVATMAQSALDRGISSFEHSSVGNNALGHFAGGLVSGLGTLVTGTVALAGEAAELVDAGVRAKAGQAIASAVQHPGAVVSAVGSQLSSAWKKDHAHFLGEVAANLLPLAGGLRAAEGARAAGAVAEGAESFGSRLSTLGWGLEKVEEDLKGSLGKVGADLEHGAFGQAFNDAKDGLENAGAESIGVAELGGLRYPVSSYESKVSAGLTRGSRIDDVAGYASLKQQGFKGIVDLTLEGTHDAREGAAAGLNTLNVKILDNSAPTEGQMKQFLDFVTAPENSPAYVHCEAGKGRTGVAVASYRMAVEGWTADQAIAEAKKFGLSLPNQLEFLQQFGKDLAAGALEGYPKV